MEDNKARLLELLKNKKREKDLATPAGMISDKLDKVIGAVSNIPATEIPEYPKLPEFPTALEMTLRGINTVTLKGDKGDSIVGPQGPAGKDGYTPIKGKDYFDGEDGHTPTEDEILKVVKPLMPIVRDGKDGSPDTSEEIRNKLELLRGDDRLKIESISGVEKFKNGLLEVMNQGLMSLDKFQGLGIAVSGVKVGNANEINLIPGANTTINAVNNSSQGVNVTITATGGGGGGITSINADTTAAQTIITGSSGTDFSINTSGGVTTVAIPTASATNRGLLSTADWGTFNGKQNALTNPVTGTGNTNEIAYFTGTSAIGSLAVATYPSLTELSYVKGVTSAIQTQLNAKGAGTVTNTGGNLTANAVVLGAGTNDTKVVAGITTDGASQLTLGVNATTLGKVKMFGNTSGDVTIQPSAVAGTATILTLPASTDTLVGRATSDTLTNKVLTSATVTTLLSPTSNDGAPLGNTTNQFSDLFLAEGGVINWDNGDITLTQANNVLTLAGGELVLPTDGPTSTLSAGFRGIPQRSVSAATTTVLADAGGHLYHPSADTTARTFTIDSNANVAYPIGTTLTFINDTSAGVVTIAITSDTLVLAGAGTTGSRTLAANGIATAVKVTSTRWIINGTGLT